MNPEQYFKKDNIGGLLMSIQGIPKGDPMHRYFEFLEPRVGAISQASLTLTNLYLPGLRQSIRKWREDKRKFKIYNGDLKRESKEFNYLSISEFIRRNWYFEHKEFDLPWLHECWLDHTNNHRMNFHRRVDDKPWISFTDGDLDKVYNEKFPVTPSIGREGILLSSFFEPLIDRIIKKRIKLVESSHEALSLDWIFELKDLINDTVSSVDILLNTIYTKAELDPLPKWTFSKQKLGEKHARRLTDKIKWIFQIGGQHLDISKESNSLTFLKELRNHLNHFDPPCFCATLEEIANWLNMITDIGVIHLKIREALSLKPSTLLINLSLQRQVGFKPEPVYADRAPMTLSKEGYYTSVWK